MKEVICPHCPNSVPKLWTEWGQKGTKLLPPIPLMFSVPRLIYYDCLAIVT